MDLTADGEQMQLRYPEGFRSTIDAALKDPELEVKKLAVNALVRFPNQEGVPKLIEVARTHSNAEVRRQAMLRLGDTKDPRAVEFFSQILLK